METKENRVRLNLALSQEANELLETLAEKNHTSKNEILRRALALMEIFSETKEKKQKLGILDQDRQLLTEIRAL